MVPEAGLELAYLHFVGEEEALGKLDGLLGGLRLAPSKLRQAPLRFKRSQGLMLQERGLGIDALIIELREFVYNFKSYDFDLAITS